jgi:hypothetical protein
MTRNLFGYAALVSVALCAGFATPSTGATPPVLYSETTHESPVRADPDDLILMPGYGLSATNQVVYQALSTTTAPLVPPTTVPTTSSATLGLADIVGVADAPYALAVHLPSALTRNQSYALWVWNGSAWSNGIKINDARPLWITPDYSYSTAQLANLPRVLKVVGRNLEPAPNSTATQVRLTGPSTYTLTAVVDSAATTGAVDPVTTPQIDRYVAKVLLPATMTPGTYTVQVSRDGGASWVALLGENDSAPQTLSVLTDPVTPPVFNVSQYGCSPDTGANALYCIAAAIQAAAAAGGGTVQFGPGVWTLDLPNANPLSTCEFLSPGTSILAFTCDGIIVPQNVNLKGSVSANSAVPATISRGPLWLSYGQPGYGLPTFSLQGNNTVSNLYFADQVNYTPWDTPGYNNNILPGSVFQLGAVYYRIQGGIGPGSGGVYNLSVFNPASTISHVVITGNIFDKPYFAITNGSLPVDHLIVTDNVFGGAFVTAIYLLRNPSDVWKPYQFRDSIVAFNTFYPSSYYFYTNGAYNGLTVPANTTGPIATQLNTALREDFSNNLADGRSTRYFYNQTITATNPKGWRAAFFWSTGNNQEMTLVSQNQVFCSGDKAGDGEAIAYDGNSILGGTLDLSGHAAAAQRVIAAAPWTDPSTGNPGSSVTVQGTLTDPVVVGSPTTPIPATQYYPGQWLRIVQGPGLGQWRKIISLVEGMNNTGATIAFNVVPALDVLPPAAQANNSVVAVSPIFWQNVTVDNNIDQSVAAGCTKFNQNYKLYGGGVAVPFPSGGLMTWYDSVGDSAMEGNQQQDASGILLYHFFSPSNSELTGAFVDAKTSSEVRNNVINGEYDWNSPRSSGGIQVDSGARATPINTNPWNPTNPPVTAFGINIGGNTITQADASNFNLSVPVPLGAIGVTPGINENGPTDPAGQTSWKMTDSTLIFHNTLSGITGGPIARAAIGIAGAFPNSVPEVWRSVLYANTCTGADQRVIDSGIGTVSYCPTAAAGSCECSGTQSVDVGVSASASSAGVSVGSAVTYVATVTNNDKFSTANRVALSVEPSPGLTITGLSVASGSGTCDLSINLCSLGSLAHGQSVPVTITAVGAVAGSWGSSISATHGEADPTVSNNGVLIGTVVGPLSVNLSGVFNVYGIFNDGTAVTNGGFDANGYSFSANLLGATVTASGTTYSLGSAGVPDAVSNSAITLPTGKYSSLNLLAAAVNGNHPSQPFVITYTDGTTATWTQSLSDWHTPQNYSGEAIASTMAYRLFSTGAKNTGPYYLYAYSIAVDGTKTIKTLALPKTRDVVALAITMVPK